MTKAGKPSVVSLAPTEFESQPMEVTVLKDYGEFVTFQCSVLVVSQKTIQISENKNSCHGPYISLSGKLETPEKL